MRPPVLSFLLEKRKNAPRPVEERKERFQGRRAFCATPFAEWLRFARAALWGENPESLHPAHCEQAGDSAIEIQDGFESHET